ncbi:ergothioneine biosynthesis protein EgtC [Phycicoccus sp. Root563]|uniref:ergothioneine biosynthesis protein EgtC n=1 Tax=Phycicoccus sp. Root563 TaxID=1736562 RepID=UPI0007032C36|nr:ergothioneine biosynthesis protein EgtC [Phycicoccus sp. Root563]KQZ88008.1 ergothioneine biosynthesis protein EgtC [Phycicoccus sp. Root563]
MCRHLAWFGAPRSVASLVLDADHGLLTQSWAPRRQAHGTVNADGWGIGLHPEGGGAAARWRSDKPIWSDTNLASMAPHLVAGRVIAAVRSATEGMPADATAAAPFLHDGWLVSHNGRVDRAAVGPSLDAESACDAALLAARVVAAGPGRVGATLHDIADADPAARLNLLLLSRDQLFATRWGDTLFVRHDDDGVLVASEPDGSTGWEEVPDRHLVTVTAAGVRVAPLTSG